MGSKSKFWLRAALIALAGCWVFAPVVRGPWLWDDDLYITQNPLLRSAAGLGRIWLAPPGVNYFPVTSTVQWIEWHLWGGHPAGYHGVNIALHLLSAFLIWWALGKLGALGGPFDAAQGMRTRPAAGFAWVGALIFAIHPVAVESVAWISELKNTLSLPLLLLATITWIDWDQKSGTGFQPVSDNDPGRMPVPRHFRSREASGFRSHPSAFCYTLSLFFFVASMLSKSTVVMFPFVLLLYAWWRRGRIGRSDLIRTAPFFAVAAVLGVVTVWFEHHRAMAGQPGAAPDGIISRVGAAGLAVTFYFSQCIAPHGLSLIYPPWTPEPLGRSELVAWLAIVAVFAVLWKIRARHAVLGLGWFVLNLVPVLGIIPMAYAHVSWVADHFAYLSLVGVAGLGAAAGGAVFGKVAQARTPALPSLRTPHRKFQLFAFRLSLFLLLAALAISAHRYATLFADGEKLWDHTIQRSPDSPIAHNNYGLVLAQDGQLPEAIGQYQEALRLQPDFAEVDINLGLALAASGQPRQAIAYYREALRLNPAQPEAHNNLCIILRKTGHLREAIAEGEAALRLRPGYAEADNNLAVALISARRVDEGIACLDQALQLDPDYAEAHSNLGLAFLLSRRLPEAIAQEEAAVRIDPAFARAHYSLGLALAAAGRTDDAIAQYQQAVKLQPDLVEAHLSLGRILFKLGRTQEGQAQLDAVARLQAAAGGQQP